MGHVACIDIELRESGQYPPRLEIQLPAGFYINCEPYFGLPTATHGVVNSERFYGIGYERGNWPAISAALMTLISSPDIKSVWYHGDHAEPESPITIDQINAISAYFMSHGRCEYFGDWDERSPGDYFLARVK